MHVYAVKSAVPSQSFHLYTLGTRVFIFSNWWSKIGRRQSGADSRNSPLPEPENRQETVPVSRVLIIW